MAFFDFKDADSIPPQILEERCAEPKLVLAIESSPIESLMWEGASLLDIGRNLPWLQTLSREHKQPW
jgi:hypothetical protein